ncbi:MAG: zinc ribbon domain-containing protein [Bacillota bacterium]
MEEKACQCCAMPMGNTDELFGSNADGSKNEEYCMYCYANGEAQFKGTMEEMIEICVPHVVSANPGMTVDAARKIMADVLPTLKFWKQATA